MTLTPFPPTADPTAEHSAELSNDTDTVVLPVPTSERWQPLRLGLVDLFYYDNEEFPFVDGRLLLRGNNGAGKSKVLALTLPFLLDGDLSPQRVEPDGDRQKHMEWNLLLGNEHPNNERLGYSWLEFGRIDANGQALFITIGAGMKAARGRGVTKHWFFLTSQRVRENLELVDGNRLALGRDRLAAALADNGHVYDTKGEYRRAVDATLFGLGERRYAELIELLLQIRAPQLSKKPSEAALSEALTRALTPVGDAVIKSVADGLRSLDEERDEVQQLAAAQKAVHGFLEHYRGYARVMLKRQAEGPRREQSEYDKFGRAVIETTAELEELQQSLGRLATQTSLLRDERTALEAEREALRDSAHAESERLLELADAGARTAADRAESAEQALTNATATLRRSEKETGDDQRAFDDADRHVREAAVAAGSAAREARLDHEHDVFTVLPAGHGDPTDEQALRSDRTATTSRIAGTREALARVTELISALERSEAAVAEADRREAETETRLADAAAERAAADTAVESAVDGYISEVEIVLAGLTELAVSNDAFAIFTEWVRVRAGENPATRALRIHAQRVLSDLHAQRAAAHQQLEVLHAQQAALGAEISALEHGESVEPPGVATRIATHPGTVPLWKAVSFRPEVDAPSRAGLEAALEASGLLTALVLPDGDLRRPGDGQVILRPADAAASARTLSSLLVAEPAVDSPVTAATIEAVLRGIALADGSTDDGGDEESAAVWVSTTGRYRLGNAHGAWSKTAARYVGESARAAERERRLREAQAEFAAMVERQAALAADVARMAAREGVVEREQSAVPHPLALEAADRETTKATDRYADREHGRDDARIRSAAAHEQRGQVAADLAADAASLHLPTDAATIRSLGAAVSDYERQAGQLWRAVERRADTARSLARSVSRLAEAQSEHERAAGECETAHDDVTRLRSYAESLREQLGADVQGYRERVATVIARLTELKGQLAGLGRDQSHDEKQQAVLEERLRGIRADQERTQSARVAAVATLERTTALGLVRVADLAVTEPDESNDREWTVTRGVQFARALDAALPEIDASDERYNRLQSQVFSEFTDLQRSLGRHGHEAAYIPGDDGVRVVVTFRGREMLLVELAAQLGDQIDQHMRLLSAKEREIIQSHLVTEVGAQLSELIGEADGQIVQLNNELRTRPTSTGMTLRVLWKPRLDGPTGLAEARRVLATTADVWNEADRLALGEFLQARIAEVRDADEAGNWYDHLSDALDYRRWHRFTVERQQGGAWKPATGPASGGERVLAASIPLFAAASSHYRTAANPHAPRMIMLDEAFAGVDDNSRASCLGLLAEFDLDVVMTSEREWGCYAEVPGLSIAQLTRFDGADAVHVQRWRWDGRQRTAVAESVAADTVAASGSLW
ncbi:TIGR02680 family protein [Cryobacterium algoritolerans]|uniref:TIGR02680 family protein n=1 Tax=Cryobacterium algoritolerans TaxID=1259184 RepID=A0A4R8WXK5_9MICO|nr:TIGR02680 family protein [Cryobacterium algoritolerans]TFC17381.1 TIGR02680 family protein [Cryobacterium algoritolerans]